MRIVLEIKTDADPELVMAYLYKHTPLQTNFHVNLTCLVPTDEPGGRHARAARPQGDAPALPRLPLRGGDASASSTSSTSSRSGIHILEGFAKVYDALDEMIRIIRKSDGKEDAAEKLMKRFELDDEQADAILELKLYRLARLEILVIQKELKEKRAEAKRHRGAAQGRDASAGRVVSDELAEVQAKYADKRRTKIGGGGDELEFDAEAFIVDEDANVVLTRDGWVKRVRELKDPAPTRLREGDEVLARARRARRRATWSSSPTSAGLRHPHQRRAGVHRLRRSGAEAVQVRRRRAGGRRRCRSIRGCRRPEQLHRR